MTIRYRQELDSLQNAYAAARSVDIADLKSAIAAAAVRSAAMIGSGGSFSVASFAAYLHQIHTGRLAAAVTPLDYLGLPLTRSAAMCFSASGRNKDIAAAFEEAANREARPLVGLVMRERTPMHDLAARYRYSRLVSAASPAFEDGFLAVGSLVGACTLLLRAYRALVGEQDDLPETLDGLVRSATGSDPAEICRHSASALRPPTTSVLVTASLKPAASDIESRFVEAALGNVHATDFRNFGHGRHHWFAKRASETGIIALVGDGQDALATRTLSLLPKSIPRVRFDFGGEKDVQALVGLIVSLHLAEAAGDARGIDPGKPGVPEFGRKLYHLGPSQRRRSRKSDPIEVAAWRKHQAAPAELAREPEEWLALCRSGLATFGKSTFAGVVFDYDGTLCETHRRYEPLPKDIVHALTHLLREGATIGIATGRGGSAASALREAIPRRWWERVLVGYYNGAIVLPLDLDKPEVEAKVPPGVAHIERQLKSSPHFVNAEFRASSCQVSIAILPLTEPLTAVRAAAGIVEKSGSPAVVSCSSHSIDITFGTARKTVVVDAVRQLVGSPPNAPILRIGDKGRWPGNDADLLDDLCGLSVDEVSPSTEGCWGLSPRGILGIQATLYYLERLHWNHGSGVFDLH
jgi:fructoselysine-6-P-deglycase FrlB-like protein